MLAYHCRIGPRSVLAFRKHCDRGSPSFNNVRCLALFNGFVWNVVAGDARGDYKTVGLQIERFCPLHRMRLLHGGQAFLDLACARGRDVP